MKTEIKFLGFIVGRNGLQFNPAKFEVLYSWPKPKIRTEVRSLCDYFSSFEDLLRTSARSQLRLLISLRRVWAYKNGIRNVTNPLKLSRNQ